MLLCVIRTGLRSLVVLLTYVKGIEKACKFGKVETITVIFVKT